MYFEGTKCISRDTLIHDLDKKVRVSIFTGPLKKSDSSKFLTAKKSDFA